MVYNNFKTNYCPNISITILNSVSNSTSSTKIEFDKRMVVFLYRVSIIKIQIVMITHIKKKKNKKCPKINCIKFWVKSINFGFKIMVYININDSLKKN